MRPKNKLLRGELTLDEPLPAWLSGALVAVTFGLLLYRELRRPLRRSVESKSRRHARNFAVAALSAAALQVTQSPITNRLTRVVQQRRWGLLKKFSMPGWLETLLAVVLLDYTLYLWHILTHKVSFLWRFHKVHHVDLDMDASTALRFHFGEMIISVAWRAGQIVFIGVSPRALSMWSTALLMEVMFHHSNAELPIWLERLLVKILVTPRMHGIHHSIVPEERESNWSSGLTVWDWLHKTLRLGIPQDAITLGVAAYRRPQDVTLPKLLEMPFKPETGSDRLPDGGIPCRSWTDVGPPTLEDKDVLGDSRGPA
jgi:sterol desaturase/sphingolipid hydroxylase (fatty acid hydroxylase superfamily)